MSYCKNKSATAALYKEVRNACVGIYSSNNIEEGGSVGSGCFISKDGYILTAGHVVSTGGPLDKYASVWVTVTNFNGTCRNHVLECDVIGMDGCGDIGILKVKPEYGMNKQKYLKWGKSTKISPGDACFIIGDPLGLDNQSIAEGVVRDSRYVDTNGAQVLETMFVTAGGFSGNSGSPIVDKKGKIIGVYTYGPNMPVNDNEGQQIGNVGAETLGGGATQRMAEFIAKKIIETADDYYLYRGQIGLVNTVPVTTGIAAGFPNLVGTAYDMRGELIQEVVVGSTAELAGLQAGYIITSINGKVCGAIHGQTSFTTPYWHLPVGSTIKIKYIDPLVSIVENEIELVLGPVDPATDLPLSGNA